MVYIVYFTELNLQICDYAQKRRICCENCKYALDENFYCHFCSWRKAAKFCHPDCATTYKVNQGQLVAKTGLAPKEILNLTQRTRWEEFANFAVWRISCHSLFVVLGRAKMDDYVVPLKYFERLCCALLVIERACSENFYRCDCIFLRGIVCSEKSAVVWRVGFLSWAKKAQICFESKCKKALITTWACLPPLYPSTLALALTLAQ